jgi:hypothetical protein
VILSTNGIRNKQQFHQVHSFIGVLDEGLHSPSDIDGVIDWQGKAFIYFEGKYGDADLPGGQKKGLQYLVDANKYPCMAIVYKHTTEVDAEVEVKDCKISQIYFNGTWTPSGYTVKEMVNYFKLRFVK